MTTRIQPGEESTANREIVVSRVFDAPRELVWQAMADPAQVVRWWGPRGFTTTIEVMDLRPGGQWRHTMRGPDGTEYPNHSIFTEVVKPERIVFVHAGRKAGGPDADFVATWTFDAVGERQTRLTVRMVFETPEARDTIVKTYGAIEGAEQTLARLAEHLAPSPLVIERVFAAPPDAVWRAITEVERMRQWFMPDIPAFRAEVGFTTEFDHACEDKAWRHIWKVTEVVPGRRIAYAWTFGGCAGESLATFELFPEGDEGQKTRLRLTHTGLESYAHPDLAPSGFRQGWEQLIGTSLPEFLEGSAAQP